MNLAGPMHKKYSTRFVWGHLFSTYVSYDRFFNPPFSVRDFIDLILSSPILTFLICQSFFILFYLRNSRIHVFVSDTHHFLGSHSFSSSLPRKAFLLLVASNYQLFHLSWSLTKLSYANANERYSGRTTTVVVTVLMKVLSFS